VTKANRYTERALEQMRQKIISILAGAGVDMSDIPNVYAMDIDELVELHDDLVAI